MKILKRRLHDARSCAGMLASLEQKCRLGETFRRASARGAMHLTRLLIVTNIFLVRYYIELAGMSAPTQVDRCVFFARLIMWT